MSPPSRSSGPASALLYPRINRPTSSKLLPRATLLAVAPSSSSLAAAAAATPSATTTGMRHKRAAGGPGSAATKGSMAEIIDLCSSSESELESGSESESESGSQSSIADSSGMSSSGSSHNEDDNDWASMSVSESSSELREEKENSQLRTQGAVEHDKEGPARKRVKLDTAILEPGMGDKGEQEAEREGQRQEQGEGHEVLRGVKWKTTDMKESSDADCDGDVDVDIEISRLKWKDEKEDSPRVDTDPLIIGSKKSSAADCVLPSTQQSKALGKASAITFSNADISDAMTFLADQPAAISAPRFTTKKKEKVDQSIDINSHAKYVPLCTETIQTKSGMSRKRKFVGPFECEDDNDDNESERKASHLLEISPRVGANVSAVAAYQCEQSSKSMPSISRPERILSGELQILDRRRRESEDKGAEMSRKMREEALAKRRRDTEAETIGQAGLTQAFLKEKGGANATASSLGPRLGEKRYSSALSKPLPKISVGEKSLLAKADDVVTDDMFDDHEASIEAQLDLAQLHAKGISNDPQTPPSLKDISRSPQLSALQPTSTAHIEEADQSSSTLGSQPRGTPTSQPGALDSTLLPEKRQLSGEAKKTVTSGNEHYDREQAEIYWTKVKREQERVFRKECRGAESELKRHEEATLRADLALERPQEAEKVPLEKSDRMLALSREAKVASSGLLYGVKTKDEARLLAAKGAPREIGAGFKSIDRPEQRDDARLPAAAMPLRAALNVNGGLASLARRAEHTNNAVEDMHDGGGQQQSQKRTPRSRNLLPHQDLDKPPIDSHIWIKETTVTSRKRGIENLMNALMQTAKCWWMAFDSMSPRSQGHMEANLHQLVVECAGPVFHGFSFPRKCGKRLTDIRHNMLQRISRYSADHPEERPPTQEQIESQLVELIGKGQVRRGKELLRKATLEYEEWKKSQEKRRHHSKRSSSKINSGVTEQMRPVTIFSAAPGGGEDGEIYFESDKSDTNEESRLARKKRLAEQKSDARIDEIKRKLAKYDQIDQPSQPGNSTRKVHFAENNLWVGDVDQGQSSESEVSDDDEDESAPSYGRGENGEAPRLPQSESRELPSSPSRKSVGGKGLLSEVRRVDHVATEPIATAFMTPTARKGLPAPKGSSAPGQTSVQPESSYIGAKSIMRSDHQARSLSQHQSHDAHEEQTEGEYLEFEVEDSLPDEVLDETYSGSHVLQYEIVADYEDFEDQEDATAVLLGRHVDANAAWRHMNRIVTDVVASVKKVHRQIRVIWDVDDYELQGQTVILPTGGECCVRMEKSWTPTQDWPGREAPAAAMAPKMFYIVHETKTTSLTNPAEGRAGANEDDLCASGNFEKPSTIVEKERDMCFSSRQVANGIAKNRLMAFCKSHAAVSGDDGDRGVAEYMEQIEHDRVCFEQERKYWSENGQGEKRMEVIRTWVEEMIADMPDS